MVSSNNKKLLRGFSILVMLGASPLSVTYVQAENTEDFPEDPNPYSKIESKIFKVPHKNQNKIVLAEEIKDGKLKVRSYEIDPSIVSDQELLKFLLLEGDIYNWTYVTKGYNSGIVLYDGKISKFDNSPLKKIFNNQINMSEKNMNPILKNSENVSIEVSKKQSIDNEMYYKVIISGKGTSKSDYHSSFLVLVNASQNSCLRK